MKNSLSNVMMTSLIALLHMTQQQAQAACVEVFTAPSTHTATCTAVTPTGYSESRIANNTVVNVEAGATVSAPVVGGWAVQVQQGLDAVNNR